MHLRGSRWGVTRNATWFPNELDIYEDRIEEKVLPRSLTALMGRHDRFVIRYEQIAAVGLHTGLLWSTLTVESTGGHTAVVRALPKREATAAKQLLEERLAANRAGHEPQKLAPAAASTADELSKLSVLRDSGALSDEEFAAAKKQLLGL